MNKRLLKFAFFISILAATTQAIYAQTIPRPEYPRPQFERTEWRNLNGVWSYTFDFEKTGMITGNSNSAGFKGAINVPFCPESKLSGIEYKDFIEEMWYQRKLEVPAAWNGQNILIHFGGVDYQSELFIDGKLVGDHWGGTSSFNFDISDFVTPGGTNNMVLRVIDNRRGGKQPGGKQSFDLKSAGCDYSRTTGIWREKERLGWYGFLSIDTTGILRTKDEWRQFCKEKNIDSVQNYNDMCKYYKELPIEPNEYYVGFTNMEDELELELRRRG